MKYSAKIVKSFIQDKLGEVSILELTNTKKIDTNTCEPSFTLRCLENNHEISPDFKLLHIICNKGKTTRNDRRLTQ